MITQYGYKVVINSRELNRVDPDEPYGRWSVECENSISRVHKTLEYPDVASADDIAPGEDAFLVWAEWSSGDSFGSGTRNHAEPFGIFAKYEDAQKFHDELSGKKEYDYSVPWTGYFESLDDLHIDKVMVRAEQK